MYMPYDFAVPHLEICLSSLHTFVGYEIFIIILALFIVVKEWNFQNVLNQSLFKINTSIQ